MAIQWKRNTRYPSVTRPGAFPRIQEFDDLTGEDILEDTWFELTGIDEEEINKFKFSLGTWIHLSRRNRKIRVLTAEESNNITYPITSDQEDEEITTEPKPDFKPPDFLGGASRPHEWAKDKGGAIPDESQNPLNIVDLEVLKPNGDRRIREGLGEGGVDVPVNVAAHDKITQYTDSFKTMNRRFPLVGPGPNHVAVGDRTEDRIWICYKNSAETQKILGVPVAVDYYYEWKANLADEYWSEENKLLFPSLGFQWVWIPSNKRITDAETGLSAYGDWVPGGNLVETENQAGSDNQYVGLVTKSPIQNVSNIEQDDLFLYHQIGSDEYKDISAPLEVYFSFNYLERDETSVDKIKYKVIEWGDEEDQMSDQQILDSEFFYLYESDDSVFDGAKYKKLCLIASEAIELEGEDVNDGVGADRGVIHSHVYIEPGIKTIKTIVFRFDETGIFLLETSIVHTNIFIGDPNQKIQNFNIFGGEEFTVLPLEEELEPIIGNIDKRSEYVRSIEKIKNNDLYQSSDYLEKLYADEFLPNVNNDLYGEYAGNIDLGITRVFKKTYNIFDFIGGDALQIINNNFEYPQDSLPLNSSATEILIDDGDCVVNLDPSNQNNDQVENNGTSDEKGVLMGDFRLVKNPKQKIRKEDAMQLPKLNTQKKRQAF